MSEQSSNLTGKAMAGGAGTLGALLLFIAISVADLNKDSTKLQLSVQRITMLYERMHEDMAQITSEISAVDEVAQECSSRLTAHESAADARAEVWRDSMRQWRDEESSDR